MLQALTGKYVATVAATLFQFTWTMDMALQGCLAFSDEAMFHGEKFITTISAIGHENLPFYKETCTGFTIFNDFHAI